MAKLLLLNLLAAIASGLLYRAGGSDQWPWCPLNQKWWRWGMGVILGLFTWHGWIPYLATIGAYYIATAVFKYGDKSWLKPIGDRWMFTICGLAFGLASIPSIGLVAGIIQGLVGAGAFLAIRILEEKGKIGNPWTEFFRGFFGRVI